MKKIIIVLTFVLGFCFLISISSSANMLPINDKTSIILPGGKKGFRYKLWAFQSVTIDFADSSTNRYLKVSSGSQLFNDWYDLSFDSLMIDDDIEYWEGWNTYVIGESDYVFSSITESGLVRIAPNHIAFRDGKKLYYTTEYYYYIDVPDWAIVSITNVGNYDLYNIGFNDGSNKDITLLLDEARKQGERLAMENYDYYINEAMREGMELGVQQAENGIKDRLKQEYEKGFANGQTEEFNGFTILTSAFFGFLTAFGNIKLLPGLYLGQIVGVFLVFGVVFFIIGKRGK